MWKRIQHPWNTEFFVFSRVILCANVAHVGFFSFFTWRFVQKKKNFDFIIYVRSISQRWRRKNVWWNGQGQMETELSGFVFSRLKGCHESSAGQARLIISYSLSNIGFLETCTQSTRHIYNVYISLSNVLTILTSEITKNQIPPTNLQAGPNRIFIRHRFCVCKQQQQQNHINNFCFPPLINSLIRFTCVCVLFYISWSTCRPRIFRFCNDARLLLKKCVARKSSR